MNTRIILFTPHLGDACSFYRAVGPLSQLRRHNIDAVASGQKISWDTLSSFDIGFMQRPHTTTDVRIAKLIQQQMRLWIDYDDDLLNVTPSNPAYPQFSSDEVFENIQDLISLADIVTVSTKELERRYKPLNSSTVTIPNAYNDYLLPTTPLTPTPNTVLWRGTTSHVADLLAYKDELNSIIRDHQDWTFYFAGIIPWMLDNSLDNIRTIKTQDIFTYHETIAKIAPSICVVPLEDTLLNRAKSNIAWLETARTGTVTIAPMWEEWVHPGIARYNAHNFYTTFLEQTRDHDTTAGWEYIKENLLLSKVNQQRVDIVKALV